MGAWLAAAFGYPYYVLPLCMLCCSGGVYNIVYAFGFGYGLSMAANGIVASVNLDQTRFKPDSYGHLARFGHAMGYVAYGVRLFMFLYQRHHAESFSEKAAQTQSKSDSLPILSKVQISVMVGTLMALYHVGLYYHCISARKPTVLTWCGMGISAVGLAIESIADAQKFYEKSLNPTSFVSTGLYKYSRHANYFGEILFHAGLYLTGVPSYTTWFQVVSSAVAPGMLTMVMFGATKSLEKKQLQKYGADAAYMAYRAATPVLFPFFGSKD
mmetsp:Transcript_2029/g.3719  ORF Transcript_2029/g.3719 Transcript_2029/m.3719 type:complete len:270 (+) Transcript_2029:69-878(+)